MIRQISAILLITFVSGILSSQDLRQKEYDLGVVAGFWSSGTVSIEGIEVDKEGSFLLRAFVDGYIMPKLAFGAYLNYAPYNQGGTDINAMEFGGSIKPRFFLAPDLAIKPGINFGYRWTTSDVSAAEIDAFGLNLSIELQKVVGYRVFFAEFGFLSQPAGGNDLVSVTFAPIIYFGGGIVF